MGTFFRLFTLPFPSFVIQVIGSIGHLMRRGVFFDSVNRGELECSGGDRKTVVRIEMPRVQRNTLRSDCYLSHRDPCIGKMTSAHNGFMDVKLSPGRCQQGLIKTAVFIVLFLFLWLIASGSGQVAQKMKEDS